MCIICVCVCNMTLVALLDGHSLGFVFLCFASELPVVSATANTLGEIDYFLRAAFESGLSRGVPERDWDHVSLSLPVRQ